MEIDLVTAANQNSESTGTTLNSFEPLTGSLVRIAYQSMGTEAGIEVQAREVKTDKGGSAYGALVSVVANEHRSGSSFIDANEIPELVKAFESLLAVTTNPTTFQFFEIKYKTRDGFEVGVFNRQNGKINWWVSAGRSLPAQVFVQDLTFRRVKERLQAAQQKVEGLDC